MLSAIFDDTRKKHICFQGVYTLIKNSMHIHMKEILSEIVNNGFIQQCISKYYAKLRED